MILPPAPENITYDYICGAIDDPFAFQKGWYCSNCKFWDGEWVKGLMCTCNLHGGISGPFFGCSCFQYRPDIKKKRDNLAPCP